MKKILCMLVALVFVFGFTAQVQAEDYSEKVKEAMKMLMDSATALGAPTLDGESLMFGTTEMNGNFDVVDEIADAMECTATIFVKKADGFERIATNVIKEGRRAIGTKLAADSAAAAPIASGSAYYGPADILGAQYETGYEPIKDASGTVIGIYYVGYKI